MVEEQSLTLEQGSSVRLGAVLNQSLGTWEGGGGWCYEGKWFGIRATNRNEDVESVYLLSVDLVRKGGLPGPSCSPYSSQTRLQIWIYHLTHI